MAEVDARTPAGPLPWDLEAYRELPSDGKRYEIIDGELHVNAAPKTRHQIVLGELHLALASLRKRGVLAFSPIDVILDPGTVVQPDLVFVHAAREAIVKEDAIHGAPDLMVEVLSPTTRRYDVVTKSRAYAKHGIPTYWIVDTDLDRIEAFRLDGRRYAPAVTVASPDIFRPVDFPDLALDLREIFGR